VHVLVEEASGRRVQGLDLTRLGGHIPTATVFGDHAHLDLDAKAALSWLR
jgi:hypothetical protein